MISPGIPLVWEIVAAENPNLSDYLDSVIDHDDPWKCSPYRCQRLRTDAPRKRRPRKWIKYNGQRHQPTMARLIIARQKGSIGQGDACHICWKNPWCCNPDHLFEGSPEVNRTYDNKIRKERREMLKKCPAGTIGETIVPVSTLTKDTEFPQGWPTTEEILDEFPELVAELEATQPKTGR